MKLPEDTTLALKKRRQDTSAVPRSMPASFYADPELYPAEVERVCINCGKIPGGRGYTGYKSYYSPSFKGRTQIHPDMTSEECSQSMMGWIYPSFVAAISPNSSV